VGGVPGDDPARRGPLSVQRKMEKEGEGKERRKRNGGRRRGEPRRRETYHSGKFRIAMATRSPFFTPRE
jgi:hypothetical protein